MGYYLIEKAKVERVDELMELVDSRWVPVQPGTANRNSRTRKQCNISVREMNDYKQNGQTFQRQSQSHFCTGWDAVAVAMSDLSIGDEVQITGYTESGVKMFIATPKGGVSFNIPQPGKTVSVTLPTGKTINIYGRARPYDMMREPGWKNNWYMHDAPTVKVMTIKEATSANAGEFWHLFLKNNPRYDKNNPRYVTYLNSSAWAQKREQVLQRDGYRCDCKSDQDLEVHHKTYENIGKEPISDLLTLCSDCHSKHHNKLPSTETPNNHSGTLDAQPMDIPSAVQAEPEPQSEPDDELALDVLNQIFEEEMAKGDETLRDNTLRICHVQSLYNVMEPPKSLPTHTTEKEETDNPNEIPF